MITQPCKLCGIVHDEEEVLNDKLPANGKVILPCITRTAYLSSVKFENRKKYGIPLARRPLSALMWTFRDSIESSVNDLVNKGWLD